MKFIYAECRWCQRDIYSHYVDKAVPSPWYDVDGDPECTLGSGGTHEPVNIDDDDMMEYAS